jgi:hypothetical protein
MVPIDRVDETHRDFLVVFLVGVDEPLVLPKTLPETTRVRLMRQHYDDRGKQQSKEHDE